MLGRLEGCHSTSTLALDPALVWNHTECRRRAIGWNVERRAGDLAPESTEEENNTRRGKVRKVFEDFRGHRPHPAGALGRASLGPAGYPYCRVVSEIVVHIVRSNSRDFGSGEPMLALAPSIVRTASKQQSKTTLPQLAEVVSYIHVQC